MQATSVQAALNTSAYVIFYEMSPASRDAIHDAETAAPPAASTPATPRAGPKTPAAAPAANRLVGCQKNQNPQTVALDDFYWLNL